MDPHNYNLLASYSQDADNVYHYDALMSGSQLFRVDFTRVVTDKIEITINKITGLNSQVMDSDIQFLTNEVNSFQGVPLDGNECVALGWTYLGHKSTNASNIDAGISAATEQGYSFKQLFYQSGYFVWGCAELELFYDQG